MVSYYVHFKNTTFKNVIQWVFKVVRVKEGEKVGKEEKDVFKAKINQN